MTEVRFHDPFFIPAEPLVYSVISARYNGKWIFVRHHLRDTFEIPGGHIEEGETSEQAAGRELMEETGALSFTLHCIATYSVTQNNAIGWGRFYLAEVTKIGPIMDVSEIAEVIFSEQFPEKNTYPEIQPRLFGKSVEYLNYIENRK